MELATGWILSIMLLSVFTLPLLEFVLSKTLMPSTHLHLSKTIVDCSAKNRLGLLSHQVMKRPATSPTTPTPMAAPRNYRSSFFLNFTVFLQDSYGSPYCTCSHSFHRLLFSGSSVAMFQPLQRPMFLFITTEAGFNHCDLVGQIQLRS